MKQLILIFLFISLISCEKNTETINNNPINKFQNEIIKEGLTGSNAAIVFKSGKQVYNGVVNSGAIGDKDITDNTIESFMAAAGERHAIQIIEQGAPFICISCVLFPN